MRGIPFAPARFSGAASGATVGGLVPRRDRMQRARCPAICLNWGEIMKNRAILAACVAVLAWGGSAAYARAGSMVCHTDAIPLTFTNFNLYFTFPLFDPNDAFGNGTNIQATLTSVSLTVEGNLLGTVALTNLNVAPTMMHGALTPTINVQRPDLSSILTVLINGPFGPVVVNGMDTLNVGPIAASQLTGTTLMSPADLALFTGPGAIILPVTGMGDFIVEGGGGNVIANVMSSVGASGGLCYHFSIIPEPATASLLVAGIAALGLRKRRKSQSTW